MSLVSLIIFSVLHSVLSKFSPPLVGCLLSASASAVAVWSLLFAPRASFFFLFLQEASHGDLVACRNAACSVSRRKERLPSQRSITGEPPCVFSLGLVWNNWGAELVADLLGMLSPVVDLDVVFSRGQEHGIAAGGREVSAGQVNCDLLAPWM